MDFQENPSQNQNVSPTSPVSKPHGKFVKGLSILLVLVIVYYLGYENGRKGFIFIPKDFKVINQNQAPVTVDYSLLWDAIKVVNDKYIDKPIDQQKILYGAVKGAIEAVGDPYTTFFPPQDLTNFKTTLQGNFGGIGAEVGKK